MLLTFGRLMLLLLLLLLLLHQPSFAYTTHNAMCTLSTCVARLFKNTEGSKDRLSYGHTESSIEVCRDRERAKYYRLTSQRQVCARLQICVCVCWDYYQTFMHASPYETICPFSTFPCTLHPRTTQHKNTMTTVSRATKRYAGAKRDIWNRTDSF